jgi:hypothetical protein
MLQHSKTYGFSTQCSREEPAVGTILGKSENSNANAHLDREVMEAKIKLKL